MRGQNTFTQQQLSDLSHNPYTFSVTPSTIRFTLAFKTLLIQDAQVGLTARKIFAKYGYDPNVLGTDRMRSQFLHIRNEAKSPGGLKESKGMSKEQRAEEFAKKELTKVETEKAVKELQEKLVCLEHELEFIKKNFF